MVTVAIQSGGNSLRMGQDKGLIPLAGRPMIAHALDRVSGLGDELLITTNRPERYRFTRARLVPDPVPGAGALAGLYTALSAAQGDPVLVVACDMPFLSRPLLGHLLSLASQADAIVPRRAGEFEPMHAVYSRGCLPAIHTALDRGECRVVSFFADVRIRVVGQAEMEPFDPSGLSFFNINTPEDLARAEQLLASARRSAAPGHSA